MSLVRRLSCMSNHVRHFSSISNPVKIVLGIETSCDDTASAILDTSGSILADVSCSQLKQHLINGGVIPPVAKNLHIDNIDQVIVDCLKTAGMRMSDIDYIAVTNRPGLPLSLQVGVEFAKKLAIKYHKPLIPIHHMEAHALIGMLANRGLQFPFLCLLLSGGHAQIALVKDVSHFYLIGSTIDSAPGELFDKIARRLKLRNLGEFHFVTGACPDQKFGNSGSPFDEVSGGEAIEIMAKRGRPLSFFKENTFIPLSKLRNCDFSFTGLKNTVTLIEKLEKKHNIEPDALVPETADFAASLQYIVMYHVLKRLARAISFVERTRICELRNEEICHDLLIQRLQDNTIVDTNDNGLHLPIVVSGGVACNDYFASCLQRFCTSHKPYRSNTKLTAVIPRPRKLCSDNGIMIAWNAVLKLRTLHHVMDENVNHGLGREGWGRAVSREQHQQEKDHASQDVTLSRTTASHVSSSSSPAAAAAASNYATASGASSKIEQESRSEDILTVHEVKRMKHVEEEKDGGSSSHCESEHAIPDQWNEDEFVEPKSPSSSSAVASAAAAGGGGGTNSATVCNPNEGRWLLQTREEIESLVQFSRMSLGTSLRDVVTAANIKPSSIHRSVFDIVSSRSQPATRNQSIESDNVTLASEAAV